MSKNYQATHKKLKGEAKICTFIYASFLRIKSSTIILLLFTTIVLSTNSCTENKINEETTAAPNILWIVLEDTAPMMGCYGEKLIKTPNIDRLAKNGLKFINSIMPSPVCSPSRSSIITGVMSTTLGTHNHHSARTEESAIYLPENVKTIPELFKDAGYFTFNNGKDDYNFTYDRTDLYEQNYRHHPLYGKSGVRLDIASLGNKKPFFGQIQLYGGKEIFNSKFKENVKTPVDRSLIELPPYLPSDSIIIEEYANHLDAIQITDEKVGAIIQKLEKSGLLNNTIVFFFSDHGMRMTRNKQFLYEGGIRVPLIIADYTKSKNIEAGGTHEGLVSGIDLGPSALALAGIPIPDFMEGKNIFSDADGERDYVISTRDRCDFSIDRIRSVRTKDYKYIRNFMIDRPYTQPTYMDVDGVPFVKTMRQLHTENRLDSLQSIFFSNIRPAEELYNIKEDPFELNNLASNPKHSDVLKKHAMILEHWIEDTDDKGQYSENEANLKLMLGIWGNHAINPEYVALREKYPDLAGSQFELKSRKWKEVKN